MRPFDDNRGPVECQQHARYHIIEIDVAMIDANELVEKKQKLFKRAFGAKYSLSLLEMQVSQKDDTRILLSVAFLSGELMTALDIHVVCEKISKWLGGELYGTVNIDFSGTNPSLEMMVELPA